LASSKVPSVKVDFSINESSRTGGPKSWQGILQVFENHAAIFPWSFAPRPCRITGQDACAKPFGYSLPSLFSAIDKRSDWLVSTGLVQEITLTAWSCAKLDYVSPEVFAAIEKRSDWLIGNGKRSPTWSGPAPRLFIRCRLFFSAINKRSDWARIRPVSLQISQNYSLLLRETW
jgi:hypothetical protein